MKRATAKATSASGARNRAGLRWAIGAMIAAAQAARVGLQGERPGRGAQPLGLGARRPRRGFAGLLVGVRDRARGGDEAAGAAGRERRRRASRRRRPGRRRRAAGTACAASARACGEVLGRGGAGDGADVGESGGARLGRARRRARERSHSGSPPPSARSIRSAAPGFEVRTSTNTPAPARAALDQRLERVAPRSGLAVSASTPRPGTAERRRRAAGQRLRVGGRRHRDVAALAVGEHEQAGGARVRDRLERQRAGEAEALEARELRLGRHAGGPGGVDQRASGRAPRATSAGRPSPRRRAARRAHPPRRSRRARSRAGQRLASVRSPASDVRSSASGHRRRDRGRSPGRSGTARRDARRAGRRSATAAGRRDVAGARRHDGAGYLTAFLRPDPAVKRGTGWRRSSSSRRCAGCGPRGRRAGRRGTCRTR